MFDKSIVSRHVEYHQSCTRLRSWALIATTTVLADINIAPTAGVRSIPQAESVSVPE
jgi:hypothetical protein